MIGQVTLVELPNELLKDLSDYLPERDYLRFRSVSRALWRALETGEMLKRFQSHNYTVLLIWGEEFAVDMFRVRCQQNGSDRRLLSWMDEAVKREDASMLQWCVKNFQRRFFGGRLWSSDDLTSCPLEKALLKNWTLGTRILLDTVLGTFSFWDLQHAMPGKEFHSLIAGGFIPHWGLPNGLRRGDWLLLLATKAVNAGHLSVGLQIVEDLFRRATAWKWSDLRMLQPLRQSNNAYFVAECIRVAQRCGIFDHLEDPNLLFAQSVTLLSVVHMIPFDIILHSDDQRLLEMLMTGVPEGREVHQTLCFAIACASIRKQYKHLARAALGLIVKTGATHTVDIDRLSVHDDPVWASLESLQMCCQRHQTAPDRETARKLQIAKVTSRLQEAPG